MTSATRITHLLIDEGIKARAHFQIWWALRNRALPRYYKTMSNLEYVDFFHAANSGHYSLFLLSLAKIFDRDQRVAGIKELKRVLRDEGRPTAANCVAVALKPYEKHVKSIVGIRNHSLVHNEYAVPICKVYELNGVTPIELRGLIDAVCTSINGVARELGIVNRIFDSDRTELATLKMLETLARGSALRIRREDT